MIVNRIKFILLFFIGSLTFSNINAQPRFYSESLKKLYNSLPEVCKQDSVFKPTLSVFLHDTITINYRIDECGVIVHVGCKFIDNHESLFINRSIVQFLEREFLKWLISNQCISIFLAKYRMQYQS